MKTWELKRTVQCAKCPWRVDVDPHDIPNGYSEEKHKNLKSTIADPDQCPLEALREGEMHIMACHETQDSHCLGWLANQLNQGNNIPLRLQMMSCSNLKDVHLIGEQHETFEDTLP